MTTIQVVFLFTKIKNLSTNIREEITNVVREAYLHEFNPKDTKLDVQLCNGSSVTNKNCDIALAISSEQRFVNEGSKYSTFRRIVSHKLWNIIPGNLGFNGQIITLDGLLDEEISEKNSDENKESEVKDMVKNYIAENPCMSFEMLQLPESTLKEIDYALKKIEFEKEVFEEWGLYAIMPNPICALSFYGAPGTGKTLAADAFANKLGKKIIHASYADIESKYHGEGPKNVQAIFQAAENQNAVLFIDEADSLLSKRLTNVTQGSEQAINSMRSQILICLEKFHGIVIFATNLALNYDKAFVSRLTNIEFHFPDAKMREKIWRAHLLPGTDKTAKFQLKIPLAEDVNFEDLAKNYSVCGREIRNAVVSACVIACSENLPVLSQKYLIDAIEMEIERSKNMLSSKDHTDTKSDISDESRDLIAKTVSNMKK